MVKKIHPPLFINSPSHQCMCVYVFAGACVCCVWADCYVWLSALAIHKNKKWKRKTKTKMKTKTKKKQNTVNNFTINRNRFLLPFLYFSMSYIDCAFAVVVAVTPAPAAVPVFCSGLPD